MTSFFKKTAPIIWLYLFLLSPCFGQIPVSDCFRIYLKGKGGTPYKVDNPEAFLSPRAIDKRLRFGIPITEEDLPLNPAHEQGILTIDPDIRVLARSKWLNTITVYCSHPNLLTAIQQLPYVDSIRAVAAYALEAVPVLTPETMLAALPAQSYRDDEPEPDPRTQLSIHQGDMLQKAGFRGNGILLAMFDVGWRGFDTIAYFRPLYQTGQLAGFKNLVPQFHDDIYEGHGHGTNCASIICMNKDDVLTGSAPEATFYFIRSEHPDSENPIEEDFWAYAAEIADSLGVDVISSSLGYTRFPDFFDPTDLSWNYSLCNGASSMASKAASKLASKGIILCVAQGNDGNDEWKYLCRPADASNVLSVGAITPDKQHANFSSFGPSADGRIKPDVCAIGSSTAYIDDSGTLQFGNGTSLATPVIAGLTACLWQALPHKNAFEIMQIVRESSHLFQNPNDSLGYGIPNFYEAYLNHRLGVSPVKNNTRNHVFLFPNPTSCYLSIFSEKPMQSATIYTLAGQEMLHADLSGISRETLNITTLSCGIYLVKIVDTRGGQTTRKIVVIAR
ncbi:MAG: S8 family peptidase [Bacteroidales bacterium]|jgi:hypothetical protein|nr:S8 family peptidase [Bacteroidales bacterium]